MALLSKRRRPNGDDVRRIALAALAAALEDGKQDEVPAPKGSGLKGVRALAAGAALYTAGRVAFEHPRRDPPAPRRHGCRTRTSTRTRRSSKSRRPRKEEDFDEDDAPRPRTTRSTRSRRPREEDNLDPEEDAEAEDDAEYERGHEEPEAEAEDEDSLDEADEEELEAESDEPDEDGSGESAGSRAPVHRGP